MKFRTLAIAAVTAAALIPTISSASEKHSLEACARAFADSFASDKSPSPAYKVQYKSNHLSVSPLEYYRHEYSFDLTAHDQKSGAAVATAKCSTNALDQVIALQTTPVVAKEETLAAR